MGHGYIVKIKAEWVLNPKLAIQAFGMGHGYIVKVEEEFLKTKIAAGSNILRPYPLAMLRRLRCDEP